MTKVHPALGDVDTRFLGSLYAFAAMDGVTADHLKETVLAATSAVDAAPRTRNAKRGDDDWPQQGMGRSRRGFHGRRR